MGVRYSVKMRKQDIIFNEKLTEVQMFAQLFHFAGCMDAIAVVDEETVAACCEGEMTELAVEVVSAVVAGMVQVGPVVKGPDSALGSPEKNNITLKAIRINIKNNERGVDLAQGIRRYVRSR